MTEFFSSIAERFSFLGEYFPLYISGTLTTVIISLFTVLFGTVIGIIFALMKLSKLKIVKAIASTYIEIVRGTPVIVQVFIWYYGLDSIIDIPDYYIGNSDSLNIAQLIPGALALALNSAAYVAEIIRAGILAVDKGQAEAAQSLGMKSPMIMRYIIMPQAIKNILPAIGNEFVVLIKESSILYVIGIQELMAKTSTIQSSTFLTIPPLVVTSIIYFILTFSLSRLIGGFERRLNKNDRN
ncbi:amino acid ABC transporter permease [uncultured Tyzzerella sp.]|uniref:amino acid ABC transporter permease n=1 Tax=uncultured Tyzzerella sp. TaxID=2321398 RepID=UPI0029431E0E|nr:amino acid ABC transporter permease [uncultured Tyzzerella sp.]